MKRYKSVASQMIHYFSRAHVGIPKAAVESRAAWTARHFKSESDWIRVLRPTEIAELEQMVTQVKKSGKALADLSQRDCVLPTLGPEILRWRTEIVDGLGFIVIRGFPVERFKDEDCATVYWGIGLHLGIPGAQNTAGELLAQVVDEGGSSVDTSRLYKSSKSIAYHCDTADIVGLFCLQNSSEGGRSRIASSVTVLNRLHAESPRLHAALFSPVVLDARGENGVDYLEIPPARFDGKKLRTFYHGDYFRSAVRHPGIASRFANYSEALDRFEAIALSPENYLEMDLRPGDIQFLSNHTIIHSRTAYLDGPNRRRRLLRLWITAESSHGIRDRALRTLTGVGVVRSVVAAKIRGWRG